MRSKTSQDFSMTQPKANKVSEPGPSWEKELLTAAVDNFKEENPHLANDEYYHKADKSMTIRSFMKGARWAQEKAAAPGEESWESIRDERVEYFMQGAHLLPKDMCYARGFDAALSLIAKPLKAELKIQDEANDILTRQLSEAHAEAASLRAENELLQKRNGLVEKVCSGEFGYDALSKDNATLRAQLEEEKKQVACEVSVGLVLREQLEEATKALEYYAEKSNWRFTCGDEVSSHHDEISNDSESKDEKRYYGGRRAREALAKLQLGELKAGRKEG